MGNNLVSSIRTDVELFQVEVLERGSLSARNKALRRLKLKSDFGIADSKISEHPSGNFTSSESGSIPLYVPAPGSNENLASKKIKKEEKKPESKAEAKNKKKILSWTVEVESAGDRESVELTLNLSCKNICDLPIDIIDRIFNENWQNSEDKKQDKSHRNSKLISPVDSRIILERITRLGLSSNHISQLPDIFITWFSSLKYLGLRGNDFRVFPAILCELESLEILDLSKNKIHSLPRDFGKLASSLKILSISRNRIKKLPLSILEIENLEVLKVEHNPISFPSTEKMRLIYEKSEDPLSFVTNIKDFLKDTKETNLSTKMDKSDKTSSKKPKGSSEKGQFDASGLLTPNTLIAPRTYSNKAPQMSELADKFLSLKLENFMNRQNGTQETEETGPLLANEVYKNMGVASVGLLECINIIQRSTSSEIDLDPVMLQYASEKVMTLVELLGSIERASPEQLSEIKKSAFTAIKGIKPVFVELKQHLQVIAWSLDIRYARRMIMLMYSCLIELKDAHEILNDIHFNQNFDVLSSVSSSVSSSRVITPVRNPEHRSHHRRYISSPWSGSTTSTISSAVNYGATRNLMDLSEDAVFTASYVISIIEKTLNSTLMRGGDNLQTNEEETGRRISVLKSLIPLVKSADQTSKKFSSTLQQIKAYHMSQVQQSSTSSTVSSASTSSQLVTNNQALDNQFRQDSGIFIASITKLNDSVKQMSRQVSFGKTVMAELRGLTRSIILLAVRLKNISDDSSTTSGASGATNSPGT